MEMVNYIRALLALMFVVGLFGIIVFLLKKFDLINKLQIASGKGNKRLSIEEVLVIDTHRKLILVKRDDVSHLILLNSGKDVVIESLRSENT